MTFKDLDGDSTVPLTQNETIGAEPGSDLSVKGRGFKGKSQVQVYLIDANGNSTYLGKIKTSAFGRVKGKLKVPDSLAAGKYTLQVNGYTKKKQLVKSSNLGMEVVEDDLGSLYFDADSYKATDETRDAVKEMAKSLDAGETVILYGYTSGNPSKQYREYNMYLAKKRTKTIKALFAAEGVQATIVIEPQGAVSPYGSNGGNANNRRVDVKPSN